MKPRTLAALGILVIDIVATAALYSRLPMQIPLHWGLHGADSFGARWEIFLLGPAILAFLFGLFLYLDRIDPLASRPLPPDAPPAEKGSFGTMQIAMIAFGAIEHIALMLHLSHVLTISHRVAQLGLPAFLVLMGNFLPRVRPNYFAGIRTPWTLASETVWRRTNRLAGKMLFFGGLLCALLVFAPGDLFMVSLAAVALGAIAVSFLASYVWWRQEQQGPR